LGTYNGAVGAELSVLLTLFLVSHAILRKYVVNRANYFRPLNMTTIARHLLSDRPTIPDTRDPAIVTDTQRLRCPVQHLPAMDPYRTDCKMPHGLLQACVQMPWARHRPSYSASQSFCDAVSLQGIYTAYCGGRSCVIGSGLGEYAVHDWTIGGHTFQEHAWAPLLSPFGSVVCVLAVHCNLALTRYMLSSLLFRKRCRLFTKCASDRKVCVHVTGSVGFFPPSCLPYLVSTSSVRDSLLPSSPVSQADHNNDFTKLSYLTDLQSTGK